MQKVFSVESNKKKMRQTGSSRCIILLVILVLMFAVISAILTIEMLKQAPGKIQEKIETNVCMSNECILSASRIISSMDSSVDPCDDFYQFACGGYMNTHHILEKKSKNNAMDELEELVDYRIKEIFNDGILPTMPETVKQAIDYHEKCIDENTQNRIGLELMFRNLELMGLPRIHKLEEEPEIITTPWPEVLIRGDKITGKTPFFSIGIEQNNGTSYLTWEVQDKEFTETIFEEVLKTLNKHYNSPVIETKIADRELFAFQSVLSELRYDTNDRVWMSVAELQNSTDERILFDWKKFLTSYLEDSFLNFDLENDKILVTSSKNVKLLFDLLKIAPAVVIDFYTWFYYLYTIAPYSTTLFRNKFYEIDPPFHTSPVTEDRQVWCRKQARNIFPDAISYEYLRKYFDIERKPKTQVMVNDIHQAFIQLIKGLDWMDEQTKRFALKKINALKQNVGYPHWLFVPGALDERNSFLKDVRGDWMNMNLKVNIAASKKFDRFNIGIHWTGLSNIEVYVIYEDSQVVTYIPAGILQPPYTGNGLASLDYASLGVVIGQKFTHRFEIDGRAFDQISKQKGWWSKATEEKFEERVQCMIDQFKKLLNTEDDVPIYGNKTFKENIADHGGLREALTAYDLLKYRQTHNGTHVLPDPEPYLPGLTNYSHKQLFFLGFANMWCQNESPYSTSTSKRYNPGRHRVMGTLFNVKEFSAVWKCPAGSKMNPVDKCIIW
ncbi:Hypothetical predicted protein [Cloeon dipterum]|uniref:Peptidase M13 N-terminal domain-containing protein n=1 Tax=Cloeon dipterum TaxID=197152 RepID=A0A8S1DKP3_9INSE|nr:Hypothetical predicted protein [Cloeon dipterum]